MTEIHWNLIKEARRGQRTGGQFTFMDLIPIQNSEFHMKRKENSHATMNLLAIIHFRIESIANMMKI